MLDALKNIKKDFDDSGIDGVLSENIQRDALEKFSYVSPIGAAGLYYHATAADFQREGKQREAVQDNDPRDRRTGRSYGCSFRA